jgi:hypothetical protein
MTMQQTIVPAQEAHPVCTICGDAPRTAHTYLGQTIFLCETDESLNRDQLINIAENLQAAALLRQTNEIRSAIAHDLHDLCSYIKVQTDLLKVTYPKGRHTP